MFYPVPDGVHFIECHIMQLLSFVCSGCFHFCKPVNKFFIGAFQRILSIYLQKPCKIYQREKNISQFIFYFVFVAR